MRAPLVLLLLAALAAACSTYDPNLGPTPFLCGTDEPRCPDGYTPVDVSAIRCECQQHTVPADAPPFYPCNGDTAEPNESITTAAPTHIGLNSSDFFPNLAICPASDVDFFSLDILEPTTIIKATISFDVGRHPTGVDFLDAAGVSLKPAVASPMPGVLVATYSAAQAGTYYVRISADEDVNYGLRLEIIPSQ